MNELKVMMTWDLVQENLPKWKLAQMVALNQSYFASLVALI